MSTWLKLLPLEIQEVDELIEPTEELKDGETVAGTISDELKKIYSLWKSLKKSADLLKVELEYRKGTDEDRGKISELSAKSRAVEMLFWIGVHDEMGLWSHSEMPGIRLGWKVVEFKPPESPLKFLFGNQP